ncbi:MAG: tetratricopeptide repeat protein [Candidatus Omnitrophica bacterium]|nr:tetratricopeptide repeat protein [Candidatus Omnitrophota bacterium]
MRLLVLILLFALLVISQINTIVDSDIWCHLKTGEYILKNFNIPQTDIFSYTLENQSWIHQDWLSEVSFYLVFVNFGWIGLNILKALIISLSFFILLLISSKGKRIVYPIIFIILSILAFGYRSSVRPEMFSYLFLCVFLYVLEEGKYFYILPFLQVIWANLHGYFILGPILIFIYCIDEFISCNRGKAKRLALFFIGAFLACFITPYFYKGILYPMEVMYQAFSGKRLFIDTISELTMPIKSNFNKYIFFWVLSILSSLTFFINLKKSRIKHVIVFAGSFMAFYIAMRYMPIFIFLAMLLAAKNLNEANLTKRIPEKKCYPVLMLAICCLIYFFASDKYYMFIRQFPLKKTGSEFSRLLAPFGACDFLEKNSIKGRIFNTLDFGSYIGYRFYPEKRFFIDGRLGMYKEDFYATYRRIQNYPKEWEIIQKKYNFDIALLRHIFSGTERILKYLYNNKEWALVYYDKSSTIFLRDAPGNEKAIEKFKIDFSKKKVEKSDEALSVADFFEKIGEQKSAEEVYFRLLELKPEFLEAGNNLAAIYIRTGRFREALEIINKFLKYYPESAELYCNKGTVYLQIGKKEEGLLMLEKSAGLNPYLRQASYMLGLAYLEKGYIEKAIRQFVKYLALDPYNARAHRILGDIYAQKGLLKKAAAEYNEANALEGDT